MTGDLRTVYFVQSVDGGLVKIGVSGNVRYRLRNLQSTSPVQLRLIGEWANAGRVGEARLHLRFANLRVHGEWFRPSPELLTCIADCTAGRPPTFEADHVVGYPPYSVNEHGAGAKLALALLCAPIQEFVALSQQAEDRVERARTHRDDVIRQAAREGIRQVDIVKATGYTRETIRRICDPQAGAGTRAAASKPVPPKPSRTRKEKP